MSIDLTRRWEWTPSPSWALDRCDTCGQYAAGELCGDFETLLVMDRLPERFFVTCAAYACAAHLSEAVALVEQRGAESISNACRAAEW